MGIERVPKAPRLYEILAREPYSAAKLEAIKLADGRFARTKEECLEILMKVNFPDFKEQRGHNGGERSV